MLQPLCATCLAKHCNCISCHKHKNQNKLLTTSTRGSKRGRNTLFDTPNTSETFIKVGRTRDIYLAKASEHMIKVSDEIPQPVKLIFPPNLVQDITVVSEHVPCSTMGI